MRVTDLRILWQAIARFRAASSAAGLTHEQYHAAFRRAILLGRRDYIRETIGEDCATNNENQPRAERERPLATFYCARLSLSLSRAAFLREKNSATCG